MSAPTWIAGAGVAAVVAAPLSIVLLFSPPSQASCTDAPIVDVPAHQFGQQEIAELWVRSGGSTDSTRVSRVGNVPDPVIAGAVGMAESGGDPGVVNSIGAGGLMQVHPPEPDYLDPGTNMHIAVRKWRAAHDHGGTGWEPWEAFTGSDGRGDDGPFRGRLPAVLGGATGAEGLAPPDCDTGGPVEGTPKHVIDTVVLAIARANGIERTVAENDAANARHGPTESGGRSDHQGPPDVAWAADMSNGVTTSEEDHLAAALAKRFGLEPLDLHTTGAAGSRQESSRTSGGYRIQLIYRSRLGGDHDDHVHLGVRKTGGPA